MQITVESMRLAKLPLIWRKLVILLLVTVLLSLEDSKFAIALDDELVIRAVEGLKAVEVRLSNAQVRGKFELKLQNESDAMTRSFEMGSWGMNKLFINSSNETLDDWKVVNAEYCFHVVRSNLFDPEGPYKVSMLAPLTSKPERSDRISHEVIEALFATYVYMDTYTWELLASHVKINQSCLVEPDGIVRMEFDITPDSPLALHTVGGSIELDPRNNWAITKSKRIDRRSETTVTTIGSMTNLNGIAFANSRSTECRDSTNELIFNSDLRALELASANINDNLFKISSYGIAEPDFSKNETSIPTYLRSPALKYKEVAWVALWLVIVGFGVWVTMRGK